MGDRVRVVTDSTSDISPKVAQALGITVVPGYVRFRDEVYRDGLDIDSTALYEKLRRTGIAPTTSEPAPEDFAKVYSECSRGAEGIVSIHISAKISRIYSSALQAKEMMQGECQIEVIDSHLVSVGLALVVFAAARLAEAGESWQSVVEETQRAMGQVSMLGLFDTLGFLAFSDRISSSIAVMADTLHIKPLLGISGGEVVRSGLVLTYAAGVEKLYEFARKNYPNVQDLAIAHSLVPERANQLKSRLSYVVPAEKIYVAELGAALVAHTGPRVLVLALRRSE